METGYVFLEVAPPDERDDGSLAFLAGQINMDISSARELRDVAYHCPPDVLRQLRADTSICITYSLLREGVRRRPSGVIRDPSWKALLAAIQTARQRGGHGVTVAQYRTALGLAAPGPSKLPQDVHDAADDPAVQALVFQRALANPEGFSDLVAKSASDGEALDRLAEAVAVAKAEADASRKRNQPPRTAEEARELEGSRLASEATALAATLHGMMRRYRTVTLNPKSAALLIQAATNLDEGAHWLRALAPSAPSIVRQRSEQEITP